MAAAGFGGLLITCEMAGTNKTERLVRLTKKQPGTMSVVDIPGLHPRGVHSYSTACKKAKIENCTRKSGRESRRHARTLSGTAALHVPGRRHGDRTSSFLDVRENLQCQSKPTPSF
jgi:hypothetical protein